MSNSSSVSAVPSFTLHENQSFFDVLPLIPSHLDTLYEAQRWNKLWSQYPECDDDHELSLLYSSSIEVSFFTLFENFYTSDEESQSLPSSSCSTPVSMVNEHSVAIESEQTDATSSPNSLSENEDMSSLPSLQPCFQEKLVIPVQNIETCGLAEELTRRTQAKKRVRTKSSASYTRGTKRMKLAKQIKHDNNDDAPYHAEFLYQINKYNTLFHYTFFDDELFMKAIDIMAFVGFFRNNTNREMKILPKSCCKRVHVTGSDLTKPTVFINRRGMMLWIEAKRKTTLNSYRLIQIEHVLKVFQTLEK